MPDHQRTAQLDQVFTDNTSPLRSRAAAVILLLYAQPLSRITQLTIDDIIRDGDQVPLWLGDPPSPAPEPVAARCSNNSDSAPTWPSPRTANHAGSSPAAAPANHSAPTPCPRSSTISASRRPSGRAVGIRQHVLDLPTPIVATALGYHQATTTRLAGEAGATWSNYAPGDRNR